MNRQRLLPWGGRVLLAVLILLAAAQAVSAQAHRTPALQGSSQTVIASMRSPGYIVPWDVIASGGGVSSSTNFQLHQTIGQSSFGTQTSTSFKLHAGYWQVPPPRTIYLPLVIR